MDEYDADERDTDELLPPGDPRRPGGPRAPARAPARAAAPRDLVMQQRDHNDISAKVGLIHRGISADAMEQWQEIFVLEKSLGQEEEEEE